MNVGWEEYFIRMAELASLRSKDTSTKVGSVIVGPENQILSTGYNDFPRGVHNTDERRTRPHKYQYTEHAERNALFNCVLHGVSTRNATMYLNWEPIPCADCARAIIQSGIKQIIGPAIDFPSNKYNAEHLEYSINMLEEANVSLLTLEWPKLIERIEKEKELNRNG